MAALFDTRSNFLHWINSLTFESKFQFQLAMNMVLFYIKYTDPGQLTEKKLIQFLSPSILLEPDSDKEDQGSQILLALHILRFCGEYHSK